MKKEDKKSTTSKSQKKTIKKPTSPKTSKNVEKILVENFISMQKVMTNLVSKFDKIEDKLTALLDLFEESAKTIAEKEINLEIEGNNQKQDEIINSLKRVLDQNKLIAKGLTLMYDSKGIYPKAQEKTLTKPYTQISSSSDSGSFSNESSSQNEDYDKRNFGQTHSSQNKKTKVMEESDLDTPTFSI